MSISNWRIAAFAMVAGAAIIAANAPSMAEDKASAATLDDIQKSFGFVPGFMKSFPSAALPGAWAETKAVEFSETTALSAK